MKWTIGDVTVTKIVELEMTGGTRFLLPQATREDILPIAWLRPHFADEEGRLRMSIHSFIVETPTRRIIVDTCLGNDKKQRRIPHWNDRDGPFLADLAAAGFPAESIDTVLCTHLHVDHVGWNTRLVNGRWVPTFPRAQYLMGRTEFDHWSGVKDRPDMAPSSPIPSPRSSRPARRRWWRQMSVSVTKSPWSRPWATRRSCQRNDPVARRAGDDHRRFHAPPLPDRATRNGAHWQTAIPSRGSRRGARMFQRLADTPVLIIGTHFAGVTAGRLVLMATATGWTCEQTR